MDVEISGHPSRVSPKCREEGTSRMVWVQSASARSLQHALFQWAVCPKEAEYVSFFLYTLLPQHIEQWTAPPWVLNKYLLSDYVSGHYIKISRLRWIPYYPMILLDHLNALEINFSIFKIRKILATMRVCCRIKMYWMLGTQTINKEQFSSFFFL